MPPKKQWDETSIIDAVRQFMAREGRAPTRTEFAARHGLPDLRLVTRQMRTWEEPIRRAQSASDRSLLG